VDLVVPLAPPGSSIVLTSKTSNSGDNTVRLYRAFEGLFELSTSNDRIDVTSSLDSDDDPQQEGRQPNLVASKNPNSVEGSFWWGSPIPSSIPKTTSHAEVRTSNGPIYLTFI
jgi:hypothetical protein